MVSRLVILAALLASPWSLRAQEPAAEATPYYPLKVGNVWHYRLGDHKVVTTVEKNSNVDGVKCVVVVSQIDGKTETELREHLVVKKDGIYRLRAQDFPLTPPVLLFPLPPAPKSWSVKSKAEGVPISGTFQVEEAEVEVPAGKFKTFKSTGKLTVEGVSMECIQYFAKDVGIVKEEFDHPDGKLVRELEKFEPAAK